VSKPPIRRYDKPAGGWDALKSTARHLIAQDAPVRGAKTLLSVNQPDGFDCPGCAWPDRDHTSTFEFCENGAKAVAAEATKHRATPELFAQHTVSELARYSDHWLEDQGRLTHPLRWNPGNDCYEPLSWDAAFAAIAQYLNALDSPDEAIFYTSGRTSNEAAFLYQLFAREFGTNNLPDCSNMCHEPSGYAMSEQIGSGKGTVSLMRSSSSARILAATIRGCSANCGARPSAVRRSSRSTRCASAGWSASPTRRTRCRCWAAARRRLHRTTSSRA